MVRLQREDTTSKLVSTSLSTSLSYSARLLKAPKYESNKNMSTFCICTRNTKTIFYTSWTQVHKYIIDLLYFCIMFVTHLVMNTSKIRKGTFHRWVGVSFFKILYQKTGKEKHLIFCRQNLARINLDPLSLIKTSFFFSSVIPVLKSRPSRWTKKSCSKKMPIKNMATLEFFHTSGPST